MRLLLILAIGLWACMSVAQIPRLGPALRKIAEHRAKPTRPLEPAPTQPQTNRSGVLPVPEDEGNRIRLVQTGSVSRRGSIHKITDGAHVKYRGWDLFADEIELNEATQIGILRGNARVIGKDAIIHGGFIRVNFNDRTYEAEDGFAIVRPTYLQGRLQSDLYVRGKRSEGSERQLHTHNGGVTTCELDHPHYFLESEDSKVRPRRRAVLRDVRVKLLGKTLFGLPYLSIPLERRSERYLPEVGQSEEEGYYVKSRLPISLKGDRNFLDARLDYMTKLGTGAGFEFDYEGRGKGVLRAYTLLGTGRRTTEIQANHTQDFGKLGVQLNTNFQRANYLNSPENTSLSNLLRLQYGGSNLNYSVHNNRSAGFQNTQQVVTFTDSRSIRSGPASSFRTQLEVTYSGYEGVFSGATTDRVLREQMGVKLLATHEAPLGIAELLYSRSIPIGRSENFFNATDRTPVLSFRTDTNRLMGSRWSRSLPINIDLSWGEFANPSDGRSLSRMFIDTATTLRPLGDIKRLDLNLQARYRQGIYSDNTAQYATSIDAQVSYRFSEGANRRGESPSLNVRYSNLSYHGFTPLDIDRTGRYNFAGADLTVAPLRRLTVSLATGYDFEQERQQETAWQTVGLRTDWEPIDGLKVRTFSTYDPFAKAWSNTRIDIPQFRLGSATISAGARYDGLRHTWGAANLFVDGIKYGRLKFSTLLAYNGYLKQFEARHFAFTYDLHCAEAVLQVLDNPIGFRSGRTVYFFIRLKALPSNTNFGLGRQGTSFGTGTGYSGF